jgi:hypothetical protein
MPRTTTLGGRIISTRYGPWHHFTDMKKPFFSSVISKARWDTLLTNWVRNPRWTIFDSPVKNKRKLRERKAKRHLSETVTKKDPVRVCTMAALCQTNLLNFFSVYYILKKALRGSPLWENKKCLHLLKNGFSIRLYVYSINKLFTYWYLPFTKHLLEWQSILS